MTRIRTAIAAAALTVTVGGGAALIAAVPANATADCTLGNLTTVLDVNMCNYAWSKANMSPLSAKGIVNYGAQWCSERGRTSYATATSRLAATLGTAKANAIAYGADSWYC